MISFYCAMNGLGRVEGLSPRMGMTEYKLFSFWKSKVLKGALVFIKSIKQGKNRNSSLMLHHGTEFYPCLFSRNKPLNIGTDFYTFERLKCYLIYRECSSHNTSLRCETLAVRCHEC